MSFVHRSIESVKANVRLRIEFADGLDQLDRQPRGRMHWHIECDDIGATNQIFAEGFARKVEASNFRSGFAQPGSGRGEAERLTA